MDVGEVNSITGKFFDLSEDKKENFKRQKNNFGYDKLGAEK